MPHRIEELDGLRAIAVTMVVAWHYLGMDSGGLAHMVFRPGRSGVDLFFVLSGFLITSILIASRGADGYYAAFYLRRAARILPVYGLLLMVFFAGRTGGWNDFIFGGDVPAWTYALFLQNFEMARLNSDGARFMRATWSLAIEEQFYLLFPFLVAALRPNALPKALLGIAALAVALRFAVYARAGYIPVYMLTPTRADSLAIGGLIAWTFANARPWLDANSATLQRACLAIVALVPTVWLIPRGELGWHMAVWGHSYLTLLYGAVLVLVLMNAGATILWPLRTQLAAAIAAISYTLYLIHMPVRRTFYAVFDVKHNLHSGSVIAIVALALAASLLLCVASYFAIERPLTRWARTPRAGRLARPRTATGTNAQIGPHP